MTHSSPPADGTECTLVLFTKRPAPGVGKQRVAVEHGRDFALALSRHLLDCAVEDLAAWPGETVVCIADAGDTDWAADRCPGARIVPQAEGNLGARLEAATDALAPNGGPLLFIGSDAPTLDGRYLLHAAVALQRRDVVLGAAADGGVVAMGCRRGWPALSPLPWSTPDLGRALAAACEASGRDVAWLAERPDIDTADALARVAREVCGDPRPARRALCAFIGRAAVPLDRHTA